MTRLKIKKQIISGALALTLVFGNVCAASALEESFNIEETEQTEVVSLEIETAVDSEISSETETDAETETVIESVETEIPVEASAAAETQEKETVSETVKKENEAEAAVGTFVSNLYKNILERDPDPEGFAFWKKALINKTYTGAFVAQGFVESNELFAKNLSDADYVEVLYRSILGRTSDPEGKKTWVYYLQNGFSRRFALKGFAESVEFGNMCQMAGIDRGEIELSENRDKNVLLTQFIIRCYTEALGREPDYAGLNDWTGRILEGKIGPRKAAYGFVFSKEVLDKNLSNEAYVKLLYRLLMNREADEGGLKVWTGELNKGIMREFIFNEFTNSVEFKNILNAYGLGNIDETEPKTEAEQRVERNVQAVYDKVGRDLKACYWYVARNTRYVDLMVPLEPPKGYTRTQWYSIKSFEQKKGNCYCYAAAFYYLAKGLGYDAEFVEGMVLRSAGWYGYHGFVVITINGKRYYCDPEKQVYGALTSKNFFMQPENNTVVRYRCYEDPVLEKKSEK